MNSSPEQVHFSSPLLSLFVKSFLTNGIQRRLKIIFFPSLTLHSRYHLKLLTGRRTLCNPLHSPPASPCHPRRANGAAHGGLAVPKAPQHPHRAPNILTTYFPPSETRLAERGLHFMGLWRTVPLSLVLFHRGYFQGVLDNSGKTCCLGALKSQARN